MTDIVLSDTLLKEYLNFYASTYYNRQIIERLLPAIQPFLVDASTLSRIGIPHHMLQQLTRHPLIHVVTEPNLSKLVSKSKLKLFFDITPATHNNFMTYDIVSIS